MILVNEKKMINKHSLDLDSRDLSLLTPNFRPLVEKVIASCAKKRVKLVPYSTVRGPLFQARAWCKGRSRLRILAMIENFKKLQCPAMQRVMEIALAEKPKKDDSKIVTHSLPGESWHHWGEAVDMYIEKKGKPDWNDVEGYKIYRAEAEKLGLTSGGSFRRLVEPVHIQLSTLGKPNLSFFTLDRRLSEKFG